LFEAFTGIRRGNAVLMGEKTVLMREVFVLISGAPEPNPIGHEPHPALFGGGKTFQHYFLEWNESISVTLNPFFQTADRLEENGKSFLDKIHTGPDRNQRLCLPTAILLSQNEISICVYE